MSEIKTWEKENWKKARGIKQDKNETNSGLAPRDYSIDCDIPSRNKIAVINGFWIWWCSAHYQPLPWCQLEKQKETFEHSINEIQYCDGGKACKCTKDMEININVGKDSMKKKVLEAIKKL